MTQEVSNKVILILALVTVVVSVLGTFTVLSAASQQAVPVASGTQTGSAEVSLKIVEPRPAPPVTGQVTLNIVSEI